MFEDFEFDANPRTKGLEDPHRDMHRLLQKLDNSAIIEEREPVRRKADKQGHYRYFDDEQSDEDEYYEEEERKSPPQKQVGASEAINRTFTGSNERNKETL